MNQNRRAPKFGEVYFMQFTGEGSEQRGWRPGMVFSNNVGNQHSPNIIALPFTTSLKKLGQPTHVVIPKEVLGLAKDSLVLCENPERMSKDRIGDYLGEVPQPYLSEVAVAGNLASSSVAFLDYDGLISMWERALKLNNGMQGIAPPSRPSMRRSRPAG